MAFGLGLVLYASFILPAEGDRGQSELSLVARLLQFAFACGVPVAAGFAVAASARAARGDAPVRRAVLNLALAVGSVAGWVLTLWWGASP